MIIYQELKCVNNYIEFPVNEYVTYQERLDENKIIYTTRVSNEV